MKREYALVEERRAHILDVVRNSPKVSVNSLAEQCGISVVTVRRDLQYLEDRKLLKRCHGGAIPIETGPAQANEVLLYRRLIASYAAALVEDNDTLFINTSSTALQMLESIKAKMLRS